MARQLRVRESGTVFSARSDAHLVSAPGVLGGSPSGVTRIIRNPGANRAEILHSKASGLVLAAGETVRIETLAGGGYSPPAERALEHLAADLRAGKVTRAAAERDYGAERVALTLRLPTA